MENNSKEKNRLYNSGKKLLLAAITTATLASVGYEVTNAHFDTSVAAHADTTGDATNDNSDSQTDGSSKLTLAEYDKRLKAGGVPKYDRDSVEADKYPKEFKAWQAGEKKAKAKAKKSVKRTKHVKSQKATAKHHKVTHKLYKN